MRRAWGVIAAYGLAASASQMLWLTFAPITTASARHFHVSEGTVGWLSEVFPLLYVLLSIPAGMALDRWFRGSLLTGAALGAAGGLLRLGGDTFAWALAGQILVAMAQPLVLNAITKLASLHLPAHRRTEGISYGSAGIFAGMLVGLGLGPALGSSGDLHTLLVVDFLYALVAAGVLAVALRTPALTARAGTGADAAVGAGGLRAVWSDPEIRSLAGVSFLGFGVFVAVTTWLQTLLKPAGVSANTAGGLLVAMVVVGIAGSAAVPPLVARRGQTFRLLRATAVGTFLACVTLAAASWLAAYALAVAVIGFFLITALPVLLELTEHRAGANGASASALIWMAGQGGGIAIAIAVQTVVHHPAVSFVTMALAALAALPLINSAARLADAREPLPRPQVAQAVGVELT